MGGLGQGGVTGDEDTRATEGLRAQLDAGGQMTNREGAAGAPEAIEIGGVRYVREDASRGFLGSEHVCVIADNGWVFEGRAEEREGGDLLMTGAHVVRRWDNGLGLGAIADPAHRGDYVLDEVGDLRVMAGRYLAVIPLRW